MAAPLLSGSPTSSLIFRRCGRGGAGARTAGRGHPAGAQQPHLPSADVSGQAGAQRGVGIFGGFVIEREKREYRGQVNLKYTGTLPLVSGIRLLALREGVEETSTLARIRALGQAGVFSDNDRDELCEAFGVVTDTLLRNQIADYRAGRRVSYYVDPEALSKRRRTALLDSLKAIHALRKRANLEFAANIF
ncbi:MAG: hypothetical protein IPK78_21095 [Rhodospirillales bacterium]|nr:hypothetical protein [Rhodospirillales bacterium]